MCETFIEKETFLETISTLKASGYMVNICGAYMDPSEIWAHGVSQELEHGRHHYRDAASIASFFATFAQGVKEANGAYAILRSNQDRCPDVYKEGNGGDDVVFRLDHALAWKLIDEEITPAEEIEVIPENWSYVEETDKDITLAQWSQKRNCGDGMLRCMKEDNTHSRNILMFQRRVIGRVLGSAYVDMGQLVSLSRESTLAIDRAIYSSRPKWRRAKRLDAQVRDVCGRVLATKHTNPYVAPVPGSKVVNVKLKLACALCERPGLPSRHTLRQFEQYASGHIRMMSKFDPVELLSAAPESVRKALKAVLLAPNSQLHVCIDEEVVFPTYAGEDLDQKLRNAGIDDIDDLIELLVKVLSCERIPLPDRLKRAQCWAAGDTSHLALQLTTCLNQHLGSASVKKKLSQLENFESALEGFEDLSSDDMGIAVTVKKMDELHTQANTRDWDDNLEQELTKSLCRYLVGLIFCNSDLLFSFVHVLSGTLETRKLLADRSYLPLSRFGPPNEARWKGIWLRITFASIDMQILNSLECTDELDRLVEAYHCRFDRLPATEGSQEEAVGGHANAFCFDGPVIWKLLQAGTRGTTELIFFRNVLVDPELSDFVPRFAGLRIREDGQWIGMANILYGLQEPAVVDLKLGTRPWGRTASAEKVATQMARARATTSTTLGVRVVAGKMLGADGKFVRIGIRNGQELTTEQAVSHVLSQFFCTEELRRSAFKTVGKIAKWYLEQTRFAFYAASLLFAYDTKKQDVCVVKMIDFANSEQIESKVEDDSGCDIGFASVLRILAHLAPHCSKHE